MRCLAVCQDELVIRMLDEILLPGFEVEFIVENRAAARRLHETGVTVVAGDPRRTETWVKADLAPSTCVIIEDNGRRNPKRILKAVRDAGGTLLYVLGIGATATDKRAEEFRAEFPDVAYLSMSELFGGPLLTEFSRSLTRARVQQYQRYFSDADRVLIMLHNDPDPDAMASGLALRNVLRRTKTTAIIGAMQRATRPENLPVLNLPDVHVEAVTPPVLQEFGRGALVDLPPQYFGGLIAEQVFCACLGQSLREDFIPYVADFFLQLEDVKWTIVAGIVNDALVISVRNLGYSKNAGEFVRRYFAEIGSAGGHRAMAKAVMPVEAFRKKLGDLNADGIARRLHELAAQFLHEAPREPKPHLLTS